MTTVIGFLNTIFWGYVLIYGLLAVGIYFTIRLRFQQILHFREMIRSITAAPAADRQGISPFQALCTSLASRVGTGNIAGVAVALVLGGPGAIFWMWMVALVGMATAYSESTLAQLYKVKDSSDAGGVYRGGPAFYIARGLGLPWLGGVFSVCLILSFGLVFNAVQANSIADAMEGAFGMPKLATGLAIAALTGVVIFGGIRQIATVAEYVVPFMAGIYLLVAITVVLMNLGAVPGMLGHILSNAFGLTEAAGGITGGLAAAMLNGVKRGLFSNEAGMGSAPNIAAAATPNPHHPSSQGFVQAFGVFIDTILICTCTALMILLSGVYVPGGELTGTQLTQSAMADHIGGVGPLFVAVAIFFFAFTSIIGNYAYSEMAMTFLGIGNRAGLTALRCLVLVMVLWGALQAVTTVFDLADASMGLMATINLIAIVALSGTVVALTRNYFAQREAGHSPRFSIREHPEMAKGVDADIWS
ncbi:sodium:alanine symporter family protein [Paracoccus sp. APAP_BH8]|uniref:Alanine:cation symporter family protein n=2 Tax=Paracoccus TaxID=265 RepID=A0A7H9BVS2_PARPN|nr:sodium:alanine symporter family protein [Paracoccus pantotrophus]MDF3856394.1 sodium:alanine symporter family protein [Paracoccus pantotrophus]QLH14975.1 alanine:cation symporter family protein [Paracoccus pantotrophus]RDD99779.1 alanine:cation symporter family protein [Paracoccus pantotrophus]RNI15555.1 alanine:cation symporter family protein [Paracoccus pantotrophus]WGR65382.1 alanine:cation symporter family protein [Paracoccus pantotrophus]